MWERLVRSCSVFRRRVVRAKLRRTYSGQFAGSLKLSQLWKRCTRKCPLSRAARGYKRDERRSRLDGGSRLLEDYERSVVGERHGASSLTATSRRGFPFSGNRLHGQHTLLRLRYCGMPNLKCSPCAAVGSTVISRMTSVRIL